MSSSRLFSGLASQLSRALTHQAATSSSTTISQSLSNISLRAAAAASARFESNVAAVHPYAPVGDRGLLVDTLDTVRYDKELCAIGLQDIILNY
jgi:hypothetical protein